MDLVDSIRVSASGLRAQSLRMRIIAENLGECGFGVGETGGAIPTGGA